uniref:Dmx like 1 n=1 Tax=Pseudonaja textilis TaxID=8673 RepID=A0A670XS26_PSETE
MNLHQVLTGAVNPGDNCFSVGNNDGHPFTAYASGCDIVILGTDFERLQIIPGAKYGNIQVGCVDCSMQQGKVSNNAVFILIGKVIISKKCLTNLSQQIIKLLKSQLITMLSLSFYRTASQVHLMMFSPDGEFFATAGKDDCLVKVWYNTDCWKSVIASQQTTPETTVQELSFSFIYLVHPRSVDGFSWRKTSNYMPRGAVCNVLLTCCKDNICRLWAETLLPNDSLLYEGGYNYWPEPVKLNNFKRNASSKESMKNALEVRSDIYQILIIDKLNLRPFRRGRRRSIALAHTGYLPHQQDPHVVHRNSPLQSNALCHFHIAASINPATDIPLLPSIMSLSLNESEEKSGPFVVHWLNNKELHFTLSMEVFLQQFRRNFEHISSEVSTEEPNQMTFKSDEETDDSKEEQRKNQEQKEFPGEKPVSNSSSILLSSAIIDHEIEIQLAEWNKNADMLFSIHPMDGSLLVWHVDWLDEYQPGMFRQVQVSFVSRIPVAFPTGDANSLCRSIVMYACTKNVDLALQQGKQKPSSLGRSCSMLISSGHSKSPNNVKLSIFTPNVMMISKHADGSLNQWLVSFAEESAFSNVLSICHKSRYCGHRFHLNDLACHSVLPLLLTTSHHNAVRIPVLDSIEETSPEHQNKSSACTSQDLTAVYSELILWRVDPVGPLSFSGGVSELARINSLHVSAFSNVAWLPCLIPSYCLGAYCNSPSACFVASDGQHLRLYQAIIDAKKLLCELSNPGISRYVGKFFNIISQQSTARPGCIVELNSITELHGEKMQLLHVFQEDFIMNNLENRFSEKESLLLDPGYQKNGFSEKFYLIVIEYTQNCSLLHMWKLHLKSLPVAIPPKASETASQEQLHSSPDQEKLHSSIAKKYQICRDNLQSTSQLVLSSEIVYSCELNLPEGVEIISIKPSAGHLSSSSIYPVRQAPYLLATLCSDGKVRFWRCRMSQETDLLSKPENTKNSGTYVWEEWPLLIEDGHLSSSALEVSGLPLEISCAHTNRLAVAYRRTPPQNSNTQDFFVNVGIFECESTGGSCWNLEQTLHLDELNLSLDSLTVNSSSMAVGNKNLTFRTKHLVHLDWMSREDGSHILTVGIGSKLYMFGQLAGKIQEPSTKEMLVLPVWENAKTSCTSRFILLRCVDLVSSVEGSPPLPVSLSWVRDGILVIGMDCEMHVYSQWQPFSKQDPITTDSYSSSTPSITSLVKQIQLSSVPPLKRTLTRSMASFAQKLGGKRTVFDLSLEMEDSGLFEAAHSLCPTLPQYHPVQLLELMDLGKVRRAKAILSHLVKCIAGEVIAISDPFHEKRYRSLSICASGSSTRDPMTFNRCVITDYTEIDSVPPLPLYALLAADEECSYACTEKSNTPKKLNKHVTDENYEDLFQNSSLCTDELTTIEVDEDDKKPKVIDLSQYNPTYFGQEHAQVLSRHLLHSSLPGLTRMEQMLLMALADTIAITSTDIGESRDRSKGGETLDECGLKFLLAVRLHTFMTTSLPPAHRVQLLHQGLSSSHFAWAFHSIAEEELLNMLPAVQKGDPTWSELRAMGIGWWVRNTHNLRRCIEKVAKAAFQRNNDPLDAAIFYLAMKKKTVIWGLYRSLKDTKMTQFFGNNFSEDRWRKAALKNAFSLLGKQRFEHSTAFFLLAGHLKDAIEVCLEKLNDIQLALVIARLYESEFETSGTYKSILQKRILGSKPHSMESPSKPHFDPFLRSMAYWILEEYGHALDTLLSHPILNDEGSFSNCSPSVFNFYNYLRTHPLLLRRHFGSSDLSSARICVTGENGLADEINLEERKLFFTAAYTHLKSGCPMLALEVLSKMPKVVKKSKLESKGDQFFRTDKSEPVLNGLGPLSDASSYKHSDSDALFDWSQPATVFQDDPLELKWDSDKNEECEDSCLVMKPLQKITDEKTNEVSSSCTETYSSGGKNDVLTSSEDIICVQLKFRACLKILTEELRTLSTGYEVDGGKLRYQLYNWLEREVVALQKTCEYNIEADDSQKEIIPVMGENSLNERTEDLSDIQLKENMQRRHWLIKYQSLLRMFLSYCILHGSHGGGLASVRMELILLLQESQQQSTIPLLFACTASAKTVVANPLLHLSNLTHDILHAILSLDSPPHPDVQNNKIHVMHTLAASLSACIYQSLCGGHNCSLLQTNQFTGMIYQTLLLSHRHSVRTASSDETVTPNTAPAQWPGIMDLIRLLNQAGEEAQSGITILLCEILTAIYLSLFIHGLATHSSNELFRIVAHPLNDKMWFAVFGGGLRYISENLNWHYLDLWKHRFRLTSKSSSKENSPSILPGKEQDTSIYKEKFIPPELSIWDYFIAKVFFTLLEVKLVLLDEDEDEDGAFLSDSKLQEHSNSNSFRYKLLLNTNIIYFKENTVLNKKYLSLELPVCSPLCHAVLKTLQRWEQVLLRRLEMHGGPPENFISIHILQDASSSGPALLRHKTLLEPTNTPFKSKSHYALSVKRLWQYLVKQEMVQETFIRNIFAKKKCLNEIEHDAGSPGSKARIIHKESDIITAFAVNKANRNCIAIASSHEIQELDVSGILATQIYTWVDDDIEMIKKNLNNVRRMASHPTLPYYLTGAQDGSVRMFEWGHSQQLAFFRSGGNSRITRMRFNYQGNKFGIVDGDGHISLYQTNCKGCPHNGSTPKPYLTWQCHNKTASDFVFISSSSLIATAGLSTDNRNICLWDTLVGPSCSLVHAFTCHDTGATVLAYAPKHQLLISGGRKGYTCLIDLRQKQQRQFFQSHDSPIKAIAVDPTEEYFVTGSAEGNIKVWCLSNFSLLHTFLNEHSRQSIFRNLGTGVMQIETGPANHIFSCGADGTVKMRILPDRFNSFGEVLKTDVKYVF